MNGIDVAKFVVGVVGVYLTIGVAFALPFAAVGAGRIDSAAKAGGVSFRLLLIPGAIALWPLLFRRWTRATGVPPTESNAHRRAAGEGT